MKWYKSSWHPHLTFDFTSTRFGSYHARLALYRATLEDITEASACIGKEKTETQQNIQKKRQGKERERKGR